MFNSLQPICVFVANQPLSLGGIFLRQRAFYYRSVEATRAGTYYSWQDEGSFVDKRSAKTKRRMAVGNVTLGCFQRRLPRVARTIRRRTTSTDLRRPSSCHLYRKATYWLTRAYRRFRNRIFCKYLCICFTNRFNLGWETFTNSPCDRSWESE